MKRRIKSLILVISIIFFAGCNANYTIEVNEDLTVTESLVILQRNERILGHSSSVENFVENTVEEVRNFYGNDGYIVESEIGEDYSGGIGSREFLDFRAYRRDSLFSHELFENIESSESGTIVTIEFKSKEEPYEVFQGDIWSDPLLTKLAFNIKVPFEVLDSNADEIDEARNVYTWYYDDTVRDKNIQISYDTAALFSPNLGQLFGSYIGEVGIFYLVLAGAVIALIAFGIIFVIKNFRNNAI